ncbi:MAG: Flagellar and Swarming motility protein, partial [Ilumatobacteraceae bacterium]|nr:Flagellar and Swarming motility protein [Ilumatobacteraceae bacterium]
DHIERLDSNHETTVHLFNGNEYVVTESAEEVVRLVNEQRAQLLAIASRLELQIPGAAHDATGAAEQD